MNIDTQDYLLSGTRTDNTTLQTLNFVDLSANSVGVDDGSASVPSIYFKDDTNSGLYRSTTDTIGLASGGSSSLTIGPTNNVSYRNIIPDTDNTLDLGVAGTRFRNVFGATGVFNVGFFSNGSADQPSISINGDDDTGFYSVASNTIGITNGGTQQMTVSDTDIIIPTNDLTLTSGQIISNAQGITNSADKCQIKFESNTFTIDVGNTKSQEIFEMIPGQITIKNPTNQPSKSNIIIENTRDRDDTNTDDYYTEIAFKGDARNRYATYVTQNLAKIVCTLENPAGSDANSGQGNLTFKIRDGSATNTDTAMTDALQLISTGCVLPKALTVEGAIFFDNTDSITGNTDVPIVCITCKITTNGANTGGMANGSRGQIITILYAAEGAGTDTYTLTPTTFFNGTSITFNDIGDSVTLQWSATGWFITSLYLAVVS